MYETEVNSGQETSCQLPPGVIQAFAECSEKIALRTVLPWSEHCTECVWPTCYSSCDLYAPRVDGRCRRFKDGMVRVEAPSSANSYILRIHFKRWGKLWSPGNVALHPSVHAAQLEKRDYRLGTILQKLPIPSLLKTAATKKRYGYKKNAARSVRSGSTAPSCFLLECYNPAPRTIQMSLVMRPTGANAKMPFQKLLDVSPGFHRFRIPLAEITSVVNVEGEFDVEIVPNDEEEITLYFGLMEFVVETPQEATNSRKVKCVVWDLDDTLWDGVLVEQGSDKLRLKGGISSVIQTLDARGILNSIASKNNPEDAWEVIKKFNLDEYFLYPQISWNPKSQAIQAIAQQLNIGLESVVFIDDSRFEREEVGAVCPQVRTLPAEAYSALLQRKDFDVPVTEESKERRKLYQLEMDRKTLARSFSDDYLAFLRHCQIQLTIRRMTEENLERVHELTQRTNQMNFSGNRYTRDVLRTILADSQLDAFVLSCEDRFGSYGVVGFSIVDRRESLMTDLMFSCRIQSKRIEHAFLGFLIRKYMSETGKEFSANYRRTPRNAPSGQVFADLGLEEVDIRDGVSLLRFPVGKAVLDDGVININIVGDESVVVQSA
jgi:FkbH-like protein